MNRTLIVGLVSVVVLGLGTAVASSAFTTATIERDATIDVVTDANGPISLQDGNSGDVVVQATSGELTVDFSNPAGSTGVNPDATYTLGDTADAGSSGTYAFSVTNTDSASHDLDFSYAFTGSDPDGGLTNVEFAIFDDTGSSEGTASESGSATVTVPSGETVNVVVTVDSTGLTASDTLSGTLTIATA